MPTDQPVGTDTALNWRSQPTPAVAKQYDRLNAAVMELITNIARSSASSSSSSTTKTAAPKIRRTSTPTWSALTVRRRHARGCAPARRQPRTAARPGGRHRPASPSRPRRAARGTGPGRGRPDRDDFHLSSDDVERLVAALVYHFSSSDRVDGACCVSYPAVARRRALAPIRSALGDASPIVRGEALLALEKLRVSDLDKAIGCALADADPFVRRAGIVAACPDRQQSAIAALVTDESVRQVQITAVQWLGDPGSHDGPLRDPRCAGRSERVVPPTPTWFGNHGGRRTAARATGCRSRAGRSAAALSGLDDGGLFDRRHDAAELAVKGLADPDARVREEACSVLEGMDRLLRRHWMRLKPLLGDRDEDVQTSARDAIGAIESAIEATVEVSSTLVGLESSGSVLDLAAIPDLIEKLDAHSDVAWEAARSRANA